MDDSLVTNVTQLRAFLEGTKRFNLSLREASIEERYQFIDETVDRLNYEGLSRKDKKAVINYLKKFTGYKPAQLYRLMDRAKKGSLKPKTYVRHNPSQIYTVGDIKLLEETDKVHRRLNARATKEILRREYEVYRNQEYRRISKVSASHINNLRNTDVYKSHWVNKTQSRQSDIGITQKPENFCIPGSIRVDTVHQREIYYINSVDEITQWEAAVCVSSIKQEVMAEVVEELIEVFPFSIFNFHSDKGLEYLNKEVALKLNQHLINQTKSRSYHCNDNAQVEGKNGTVIRKNMGYRHIDREMAGEVNKFCRDYLNPYINYHRPCIYMNRIIFEPNGKRRPVYGSKAKTPYTKLKEIAEIHHQDFLKPNLTFDKLDRVERQFSDNQFARILRREQDKLFKRIKDYRKIKIALMS